MKKTHGTKRALLMSALALVLCFSMLIGSTFAWFTDSVTSAGNKIVAGNLDVDLYLWTSAEGEPTEITEASAPIFGEGSVAQNDNASTLWEPGKTQVAYLSIKNNGNLDLKYQVALDVQNVAKDLYKVMEYAITPDAKYGEVTSWTSGTAVTPGANTTQANNVELKAGQEHFFALSVHMLEIAGNEYMDGQVNFDIKVLATQLASEFDSFDNQYDAGAMVGTYVELKAGGDLLAALASAEADTPVTVKLLGDVEWPTTGHNGVDDITPASSITILGNGHTITAIGAGVTGLGDKEAPMTLKNMNIVDKTKSYNESAWEFCYLEMGGTNLTCVNVDFVDPIMVESASASFTNCSFVGHPNMHSGYTQYGVWAINGATTFSDCTFSGTRGLKVCDSNVANTYAKDDVNVVVDGCRFIGLSEKPGVAIDYSGDSAITFAVAIKNSTFIACQPGDQGLYVYETDNYVPVTGNNTVDNDTAVVASASALTDAIKKGGTVILSDDIAMTGSIAVSNADFVLDGKGHTITMADGATNAYALFDITGGKATIKNVTFDGIKGGAIVRTVGGVEFNADNVTAVNGNHTQVQGIFRLLGKNTIENCTFKNNVCNMVVSLNYDAAYDDPQVVKNCVFEGNTCSVTGVLYYVTGASCTLDGNKFIGNTVNCNNNGATVFMGFTENNIITNNVFKDNVVKEAGTSKRVAGALMVGHETVITNNAFIDNRVEGTNAKANDVCASVYYTDIDLSGNYWGGEAPVENDNYFVEYPDHNKVIINDYLTTYGN